jgi:hypothetical protein
MNPEELRRRTEINMARFKIPKGMDAQTSRRLTQLCANCQHPVNHHDPEDGTCDVFSGDYTIGVCQCGRAAPSTEPAP